MTSDLKRRILKHNAGGVDSTKHRRPFVLEYSEAYEAKAEAMERERRLKSLKSHLAIEEIIGTGGRAPR